MNRVTLLLILLVSISAVVMFAGFLLKDQTRYHNNFIRLFPPHAADLTDQRKLNSNMSLVGIANHNIYLKENWTNKLLILDHNLIDSSVLELRNLRNAEVIVDSPWVYVKNSYDGILCRRRLGQSNTDTIIKNLGFTGVQTLSNSSVVLRTIDMNIKKSVFLKVNNPTHKFDVLEKQVDGILCTDGYLDYSKNLSRLIYIYRYRNQFISLDTNLNVVLRGKTIDTTSVARISVAEVDGKLTMSSPPLVVNRSACVDGKYLFVHSNLAAKNETTEEFQDRSAIDVYEILDGSYKFSFYIDKIDGSRMQTFRVRNGIVIAMFPNRIARYDIPKEYLSN